MSIIPIFRRQMVAAARQQRLQAERSGIVFLQYMVAIGTILAWYESQQGSLASVGMGRVVDDVFAGCLAIHLVIVGMVLKPGALSIVDERTRRTLDFLLVTRVSSAEIIAGKLAACMTMVLTSLAAGLPMMLLLHALGGIELRLIVLMYAGVGSSALFLSSLAIWVSTETADRRATIALYALCAMTWMIGPFSLAVLPPKWGVRLPGWLAEASWGAAQASPMMVIFHILLGQRSWTQLVAEVGRMAEIQLGLSVLLTLLAAWRLRPANRALGGVDREAQRRARKRFVWRIRARPPVGDDPILWREQFAPRYNGFVKALNLVIWGGLTLFLAAGTLLFAWPAFLEARQQGYMPSWAAPDGDVLRQLIVRGKGWATAAGQARADLNAFIRMATLPIVTVASFLAWGIASEVVSVERMKQTWSSLLATRLEARDIFRAAILAALWRARLAVAGLAALWTLGMALGALHPLGVLVAALVLAASFWQMAILGVLGSILVRKVENAASIALVAATLMIASGLVVLYAPAALDTVIVGACSMPLVVWTSLMTYQQMAVALAGPLRGDVPWTGLRGGHLPLVLFATWALAFIGQTLAGCWAWRYGITHFDRLVGRPCRTPESAPVPELPARAFTAATGQGSPLAEADGAV